MQIGRMLFFGSLMLIAGCAYSPGYSQFQLSTPTNKQCLYLNRDFVDTKGLLSVKYIYPAGYYRPEYSDKNGTYYKAPRSLQMKSFVNETLNGGGIYLSNQNQAYGYSWPKLGTYGPITVDGVKKDELPPTILFKLSPEVIQLIKMKPC